MTLENVQFYIESDLVELTQVYPTIKGLFEYKKEDGKLYFKHTCKDKFKFTRKADYALVKQHFADECAEITLTVNRRCGDGFELYWQGFFKTFNAIDDRDFCTIEVKVEPYDGYKCFEESQEILQNVFSSGSVVTAKGIGGELEEVTCINIITEADLSDYTSAYENPLEDCLDASEYCLKENLLLVNGNSDYSGQPIPFHLEQRTTWHRETAVTPCLEGSPVAPTYSDGWVLLTNDCGGSGTATYWRCPTSGGAVLGGYSRGRLFNNVVLKVLENMGCELEVKSDFFGINPLGDAPDNIAYDFAAAFCQNISFHQKSDIKLKYSLTPGTSNAWELRPKDFFGDIAKMFNVRPVISEGVLLLEHYSFFTSAVGMDLTGKKMPKRLEYGTAEDVRIENYHWPEESSYAFRAKPIYNDCGTRTIDERCVLFHTDAEYIENPDNADFIGDAGFVLLSNGLKDGSELIINDNNDPFKWSSLQEALFKHGRLYKSGSINGTPQNFLSWIRYIKQDKFKTPLCCSDVFDPQLLVLTDLGVAGIDTAVEDIYKQVIELALTY